MSPLPLTRRYNWEFVRRKHRRCPLLLAVALNLALALYGAHEYFTEHNNRLDAEALHLSLLASTLKAMNFGAPGWIKSDWTEGTNNFDK